MFFFPADSPTPAPLVVVSLEGTSRQRECRSSIHARHLLDDEAFGYLKRVIVTPAVCQRLARFLEFNSQGIGQKSHWVHIPRNCHSNLFEFNMRIPVVRFRKAAEGALQYISRARLAQEAPLWDIATCNLDKFGQCDLC